MRWLTLDLGLVAMFALIGRASHQEGISLAGWWHTAWPFLSGAVIGWLALVALRRTPASVAGGFVVWACTLVGGMLLRRLDGQGTAAAFVVVAAVVLGLLLIGSRSTARRLGRSAGLRASS